MIGLGLGCLGLALGGPAISGAAAVAMNDYFANDGSTYPWLSAQQSFNSLYVPSTTTTWFAWEAYVSTVKQIEVTTYNHTTSHWTPVVVIGTSPLAGANVHGGPVLSRDANGFIVCVWGAHNSLLNGAVTSAADEPMLWTALSDITGTHTYPHLRIVGSALYLFDQISPSDTDHRWTVTPTTSISAAGVPTFGTRVTLLNFNDGGGTAGDWVFGGSHVVNGTDVHFVVCWSNASEPDDLRRNVYYFVYDTTNGNIKSIDGITTILPAAFPVTKAQADLLFRIFAHSGSDTGCIPSMALDTDSHPHVSFSVGTGGTKFTSQTIKHVYWNGSVWSSPADVGTITDPYGCVAVVPKSSGIMEFWWNENGGSQASPDGRGGAQKRRARAADGTWGAVETILVPPRANYGLYQPSTIQSPHANARVVFSECPDGSTLDGTLRMFAHGDAGLLHRPTNFAYVNSEASAFTARFTTPPTSYRASLYDELFTRLKAIGLSKFDGIWIFAAADVQAALLNLIAGGSDATRVGTTTFTADQGIAGNAVDGYIETNINPSTLGGAKFTLNSGHIAFYNRTSGSATSTIAGINDGSANSSQIVLNSSGSAANYRINQGSNSAVTQAAITGFTAADRSASNAVKRYSNGIQQGATQSTASSSQPNTTYRLGRVNTTFTSKQFAAATIGQSLSDSEHLALWNAIRSFLRNMGAAP